MRFSAWNLASLTGGLVAFVAGVVLLASRLDLHMLGHVLLVDVAAALAVLGIPVGARRVFVARVDAFAELRGVRVWMAAFVRSPVAVLTVWTGVLSVLLFPFGHRWAMTGVGRLVEPVVLLVVGGLFWRVTFDSHRPRPIVEALKLGGLAWWGRHVFAMTGRVALIPGILALWFWNEGSYGPASMETQVRAAGVVLGSEMFIFSVAFVLFFGFCVTLVRDPEVDSEISTSQRSKEITS